MGKDVKATTKNMVYSVIGGLIVGVVITAANFSGTVAVIAGILVTVLLASALMEAF